MAVEASPHDSPMSGPVIGAIVKAFGLQADILQSRTARRYFGGERIKKVSRFSIYTAIGKELASGGNIPAAPFPGMEGFVMEQLVSMTIGRFSDLCIQLGRQLESTSGRAKEQVLTAPPYSKLAAADLALRASAVLWVASLDTPEDGTPLWAQEKGGAEFLRQLLDRCGKSRPTRAKLAEQLDVSCNTVDNWLDYSCHPSKQNIEGIAKALAPRIVGADASALKSQIHRHYILCTLCDGLSVYMGRQTVRDLGTALVRYIREDIATLKRSNVLEPAETARPPFFMILSFSLYVPKEHLLPNLLRREREPLEMDN